MQNHIADSFVVSRQMRIATAFPENVIIVGYFLKNIQLSDDDIDTNYRISVNINQSINGTKTIKSLDYEVWSVSNTQIQHNFAYSVIGSSKNISFSTLYSAMKFNFMSFAAV